MPFDRRRPPIAAVLLAAALALAASMATPRGIAAAESVDAAVVGVWRMAVPVGQGGVARWTWLIRPDGSYSFRSEGPGDFKPHDGTVSFRDGRWSLNSTHGLPWTDGGTYELDGDILVATGRLGAGLWRRADPVEAGALPAGGGSDEADQAPALE